MRGGFGVGLEHPKRVENLGTLLRSAHLFGAAFVFTVGRRYRRDGADCIKAHRHMPVWHFDSWAQYRDCCPYAWTPVAVELTPSAEPLAGFRHPDSAVYLLGPEDGNLSREALAMAKTTVVLPSARCLNVAVAGSIIMYDRVAKQHPGGPPGRSLAMVTPAAASAGGQT